MRSKRLVPGLDNTRKIRIIVNGVGFCTTVQGAFDMCFHSQRIAVSYVLTSLGNNQYLPQNERPSGLSTRLNIYDHDGKLVEVDVQVDLL